MSDDSRSLRFNPKSHTNNSSYREKLIEHLFVADLLKLSWLYHQCSIEIAKPEVDDAGYDIIAETLGCVRHIQLKTTISGGKKASQKVHTKLASKPSGCVVWIYFDPQTLSLGPFFYFGSNAGEPLPSLVAHKTATHTKGNKAGFKAERPNIRVVTKGRFQKCETIEDLFFRLFQIETARPAANLPQIGAPRKDSRHAFGVLPIDLTPANPAAFKQALLRSRRALIEITYSNGTTEVKDWNADRFSGSSNVIGNLRSRPEFRAGKWQASGVVRVSVRVEPPVQG